MNEKLEDCMCSRASVSGQVLPFTSLPQSMRKQKRSRLVLKFHHPFDGSCLSEFVLVATSVLAIITVNCECLSCPPIRWCELFDSRCLILLTFVAPASSTVPDTKDPIVVEKCVNNKVLRIKWLFFFFPRTHIGAAPFTWQAFAHTHFIDLYEKAR